MPQPDVRIQRIFLRRCGPDAARLLTLRA